MNTTTTTRPGSTIRTGDTILDGARAATVVRISPAKRVAYADGAHTVRPALLQAGSRRYVHNIDHDAPYRVVR